MKPTKLAAALIATILAVVAIFAVSPAQTRARPENTGSNANQPPNQPAMAVLEVRWWPESSALTTDHGRIQKDPLSLESLRYKIANTEAIGRTVDELGLTDFLPHREDGTLHEEGMHVRQQFINLIANGVEIELSRTGPYSALLYVKFTYSNRKQTPRIVNSLVDGFIADHEKESSREHDRVGELVRNKIDHHQAALKDLDAQVLRLHLDHPSLDPASPDSPENAAALLAERVETTLRQRDLAVAVQERLAELHRGAVGLPPLEQPAVDDVSTQIAQLQGEADYAQRELGRLRSLATDLQNARAQTLTARQKLHELSLAAEQAREQLHAWQTLHQDMTVRAAAKQHGVQYRILERAHEIVTP